MNFWQHTVITVHCPIMTSGLNGVKLAILFNHSLIERDSVLSPPWCTKFTLKMATCECECLQTRSLPLESTKSKAMRLQVHCKQSPPSHPNTVPPSLILSKMPVPKTVQTLNHKLLTRTKNQIKAWKGKCTFRLLCSIFSYFLGQVCLYFAYTFPTRECFIAAVMWKWELQSWNTWDVM